MANITVAIIADEPLFLTSEKSFPPFGMKEDELTTHFESLPVWEGANIYNGVTFPTVDRNGTISGTVKVQGVLKHRARVSIYFRKTGVLIGSTFTDKNGAFSFHGGLNRNVADYYAVAICDEPFNAQVFDKLTPL